MEGLRLKRSPLQRKTPLKRTGINRKRKSDLQKRKDDPGSTYWRNKADALWSELIRSQGRCAKCGKEGRTEAHHLLTRSRKHLRHKLENGLELCMHCHKYGKESAHDDPVAFAQWLSLAFPVQYTWVSQNKNKVFHGKPDYKKAYEDLLKIKEARG